jgi:hypothetical protein
LVVDDRERALAAARAAGADVRGNDFRDPWGNNVQLVAYEDVQFTKAPSILAAMGLELEKTDATRDELRRKLGPDAAS